MKRTYFHGTTADNLKDILANGLNPDADNKLWSVSGSGVYMWSPDALAECGETEEDYAKDHARDRAYESAQCGLGWAKDCRCVVFEIELDETEVEPDESCEHMSGAVVCNRTISADEIKAVYVSPDLSLLKGYFLALMLDRPLTARDMSKIEEQIARTFAKAEIYIETSDYPLEVMEEIYA